ncbi:DsbA family oxidoreductase [Lysobacter sp. GCM10012299]|uniref:DsbA family oxidoreductase n=1 Tax=Lysobacter sp. GCM10012299 TaxID=3317333 RepID=UPI0036221851
MSTGNKLTIGIHFDLICPWCFIGKHQFAMARGKYTQMFPTVNVETLWHPVQLLPDVPTSGLPFAEFYERRLGSPEAVKRRQKQVAQAASSVGLELDLSAIKRMPNTARAHHLLRRVATSGGLAVYEALLDRLFAAYFQRGEDIGDAATLQALATEVGVPSHVVDAAQTDVGNVATTAAVEGVPHFEFNGRLSLSGARDAAILLMAMSKAMPGTKELP